MVLKQKGKVSQMPFDPIESIPEHTSAVNEEGRQAFIMIPRAMLASKLNGHCILLFGALVGYSHMETSRELGYVFVSNSRLAELFEVGVVAVSRWLAALEAEGLIQMKHIKKRSGTERRIIITEKGLALINRDMSQTIGAHLSERISAHLSVGTSAKRPPNRRGFRKSDGKIDDINTHIEPPPASVCEQASSIFVSFYMEKFGKAHYPTKEVKAKLALWLSEMGSEDFTQAVRGWFRADDDWTQKTRHSARGFCSDPSRYLVKLDAEKCMAERINDRARGMERRHQENDEYIQQHREPARVMRNITPSKEDPPAAPVLALPAPPVVAPEPPQALPAPVEEVPSSPLTEAAPSPSSGDISEETPQSSKKMADLFAPGFLDMMRADRRNQPRAQMPKPKQPATTTAA